MHKIVDGEKLDFCDVLIRPKRSQAGSRKDIELFRKFRFPHSPRELNRIPIMAANMDTTGTIEMGRTLHDLGLITCLHKFNDHKALVNELKQKREGVWVSVGVSDKDAETLKLLSSHGIEPNICIDVANGYTEFFVRKCEEVRKRFPFAIIMAGNVCTPEMVEELIIHGLVDIVKVGIGPGSVCTTRLMTGVGFPQLSAIMECADAAHGLNGHICADGGCTCPGDIAKAFGANADFVMIGGMLAGTDECDGEWVLEPDNYPFASKKCPLYYAKKTHLKFHGMSSREAMEQHYGEVAPYRAAEGKEVTVPYKGPAKQVIGEILGGLRSACSYVGAMHIKDMGKCTTFIRILNGKTHNGIFGNA